MARNQRNRAAAPGKPAPPAIDSSGNPLAEGEYEPGEILINGVPLEQLVKLPPPRSWSGTIDTLLCGHDDWPGFFVEHPRRRGEIKWAPDTRPDDYCRRIVRIVKDDYGLTVEASTVRKALYTPAPKRHRVKSSK
jgi:hypothetical protein